MISGGDSMKLTKKLKGQNGKWDIFGESLKFSDIVLGM